MSNFLLLFPGNNRITDSAVKAIAKSCPELRHVFIADCPRLTDLALKALSGCKYLIVLNIADCVRYGLGQKMLIKIMKLTLFALFLPLSLSTVQQEKN